MARQSSDRRGRNRFVRVEDGAIEIRNPADGVPSLVTTSRWVYRRHRPDRPTGDRRRSAGVGRGCCGSALEGEPVNRLPALGETHRRVHPTPRHPVENRKLGLTWLARHCKDTNLIREFLYKNFVPTIDRRRDAAGPAAWPPPTDRHARSSSVRGGRVLKTALELAECAGVWRRARRRWSIWRSLGLGPRDRGRCTPPLRTLDASLLDGWDRAPGRQVVEDRIYQVPSRGGAELATRGVLQMLKFGAQMVAPVAVERIVAGGDEEAPYALHLDSKAIVQAKVVLVATGVRWRKLPVAGAERFESAGVHFVCTAVEAALYDDRDVVVVGGGNAAGQAVMHLAECCRTRRVHLLVRGRLGTGMSEYLVRRVRSAANVTVHGPLPGAK